MDRRLGTALVIGLGTVLFGAALATKGRINPWITHVAASLVAIPLALRLLDNRWQRLRLSPTSLLVSVALGALMVAGTHGAFAVARHLVPALDPMVVGLYRTIDSQSIGVLLTPAVIPVVVIAEELLWRGLAFDLIERWRGRWLAAVASTGLYVLPQLIGGEVVLIAAAIVVGLVFAIQRIVFGSVLAPILTHAIWSVCIFSLLPLA